MRKSHTTGNLDRDTLLKFTQAVFLSRRQGRRKATPFRYIEAAEYLARQPKFGETSGGVYRSERTLKDNEEGIQTSGETSGTNASANLVDGEGTVEQVCDSDDEDFITERKGNRNVQARKERRKGIKSMREEDEECKRYEENMRVLQRIHAEMGKTNAFIQEVVQQQKDMAETGKFT